MPEKTMQWTPAELTKAKTKPDLVEVPSRSVLAISGSGSPDSPEFAGSVGALYGVSYALRFARKKAGQPVFKVGVLEGEWWAEGDDLPEHGVPSREAWRWRLRMGVPPDVTPAELEEVVDAVTAKRGGKLEGDSFARAIELVDLPAYHMARILHVGPYAAEPESFQVLGEFLAGEGLERALGHVEVYLSDPGRTPPEKLKTSLLVEIV
jgi:hypothetical protein